MRATSLLRHSPWDGLLVALSFIYGALLLTAPSLLLVALGLWWCANTVGHNFVHLPFFRSPRLNAVYSVYLSLVQGFPQHLWRARHLAHHAGREHGTSRWNRAMFIETALILALWSVAAWHSPRTFFLTFLPGFAIGLGLCELQGHFEHARGTTSHYGRVYNAAFFNDGYHVEHHARPAEHWTRIRRRAVAGAAGSRWPPVLRWIDAIHPAPRCLDALERIVVRVPMLQRWIVTRHAAAFRACLASLPPVRRVTIVGGGLFPRTALVLRALMPEAAITIIDSDAGHLSIARTFLGGDVRMVNAAYSHARTVGCDLLVVPLAFVGDRSAFYESPPAPAVLVHDWAWHRAAEGARVSWVLLKRVNLVHGRAVDARLSA